MNFIQYIDDTYAVKVKELEAFEGYSVRGIQTPFFILSVFIDNKRVQGVDFINYDSLPMLSVINDLGNVDLNVIPENYFATAFTEIYLSVPYSSGSSSVEISNFSDFQKKPLRYLKEYKLPQFRLDGRFTAGSGYQVDTRVYSFMRLGTIQGDNKFYTLGIDTYRNSTHLDSVDFQGESPNYIRNGYDLVSSFPVQNNGGIVQFGDYYIKMTTTKTSYPYGLAVWIFTDIRTNEFWVLVNYIEVGTSIIKKGEFDMSTFVCVNGGFKIKNLLHEVEIQISNIYG
ncbi:hypothetical protein B0A79_24065 [Flavobacterium piscis]|uniref:Uncharacterized protein n=1 Tax=Flavobacterium piscis TaxID=1114874 RepID=A0ABX2XIQ5_9FLAO|nr:hypothetical protein [Flavobacterium piscis]OCB73837.1 hypothetical protein FLP_14290 [Flavobacterium piscis]OXE95794.1 hypothetical protein B0A79_24065 [Flavobacterium piscis]